MKRWATEMMGNRTTLAGALLTVAMASLCACSDTIPEPEAPLASSSADDVTLKSDRVCISAGRSCRPGGASCCAGHFCGDGGYGMPYCVPQLDAGGYCRSDEECRSNHCTSNRCVGNDCGSNGHACAVDHDCCADSYCFNQSYAPPTCKARQLDGTHCYRGDQCRSGVCTGYLCGKPAAHCSTDGSRCRADSDCCGRSFCNNFTYAPWTCVPPQAAGAFCSEDKQCASDHCVSYACAP